MKTILFAAHDPGGANIISPIVDFFLYLGKWEIVLALLGVARDRLKYDLPNVRYADLRHFQLLEFPNENGTYEEEIVHFFETSSIDVTFTATSFNSNLEKLLIKHSRLRGIPSVSIIDAWARYRERFLHEGKTHFPDIIFVTDEKMRNEVAEIISGPEIIISGNPRLQQLRLKFANRRCSGVDRNTATRIVFFSDNLRRYYPDIETDEFYMVDTLLKFLAGKGIPVNLRIKPHPIEPVEPWRTFVAAAKPEYAARNISIEITTGALEEALADAHIALGISTMALLEASACGVQAFSCQMDFQGTDYCYIPYEEYGIDRILCSGNLERVFSANQARARKFHFERCFEIIGSTIDRLLSGQRVCMHD